jgi:hypothetical protein
MSELRCASQMTDGQLKEWSAQVLHMWSRDALDASLLACRFHSLHPSELIDLIEQVLLWRRSSMRWQESWNHEHDLAVGLIAIMPGAIRNPQSEKLQDE